MITFLIDTYACQTCFIPITSHYRAFAQIRLLFSSHIIRNQYISQHAPLTMQGTCVKSIHKAIGLLKDHFSYCSIPGAIGILPAHNVDVRSSLHNAMAHKNSSIRVKISPTPIESLRYFEPCTIST